MSFSVSAIVSPAVSSAVKHGVIMRSGRCAAVPGNWRFKFEIKSWFILLQIRVFDNIFFDELKKQMRKK